MFYKGEKERAMDAPVSAAEPARDPEGPLVVVNVDNRLPGVAVADSRLDPSYDPAQRRAYVQEREPGMADPRRGFAGSGVLAGVQRAARLAEDMAKARSADS